MLLVLSFVFFMLLGLPLFGVIGLASIISMIGMPFPMEFIPQNLYTGMDQFPLIATIGFVMAGFLMEPAGITGEIIEVAKKAVGNIRGGLAMVTILACMIFAALSGSGPATTAAIGSIMIPGMIGAGYRKDDAAAVSATGGTLGILIPPSIPMVVYGVTANASIGNLFIAGIIPGLLAMLAMILVNRHMHRKYLDDEQARRSISESSKGSLWRSFFQALPGLLMPVIILGGIYGGIFTATEAAAVASLYVMFLGFFVYGTLRVRDLPAIFWNTVEQTAKVMFVIATAGFFQYVLLYTRIPQQAIAFMSTSFATAAPVLLLIIALLVLMGCFMEGTAILLITVPIFVPLAKSFGYDIVQLGIVMCISLAIGVLTPPVGLNLYVMSSITGEHVLAIAKEAVGYVLIMIIVAILVAFIPELSLGFAKWVP